MYAIRSYYERNILGIMMQTFVSLGITTIMWISFGYSLCFSGGEGGIIGNFDLAFLSNVPFDQAFDAAAGKNYPTFIFIAYQMMFAIITPALITGAFVNRISFKSYLIFLVAWQIFRITSYNVCYTKLLRCFIRLPFLKIA